MIVLWPVDYVDTTVRSTEEVLENGGRVKVPCCKRCRRNLYINTDTLAPRDKFWVDIALEYQKIVGNPEYFIMLRPLFKEGDWTKIKHDAITTVMTAGWYFENAAGEQVSDTQFAAELQGTSALIKLPGRRLVPADLSEEQARAFGIPEMVPLRSSDFDFETQDIEILNRFVESAYDLCNSSLRRQQGALILHLEKGAFTIEKNITQEQYLASLIIFRKLYADKEPARFKKAVKILQNTLKVHHPLVGIINNANKQYETLLKQKTTDSVKRQMGEFLKDSFFGDWCPTGQELIKALFNVNCIHQGDDDTLQLEQRIRAAIPSGAVVEFSLWILLKQLCVPIITVATYARIALLALDQLRVKIKPPVITNKELEFKFCLTKKIPILAEIIWRENGCPESGVIRFCGEAERQIIEKFNLPQDYFSNMNIVRK